MVYFSIITIWMTHIGISLCIRNCNLLSYVACCAWLVFLPSQKKENAIHRVGTNDNSDKADSTNGISIIESRPNSSSSGSLITLVMITCIVSGNIWFETIATDFKTESARLLWSTLLHNRWNVFIGAEKVSISVLFLLSCASFLVMHIFLCCSM